MHPVVEVHREALAAICRRFAVARLDVFGSAARAADFDPATSDADFLVTFAEEPDMSAFLDLKEALEAELGRRVDLVERLAVERTRNHIRRRHILAEAQPVFAA
jgi:predicted nucleotidyltransferase